MLGGDGTNVCQLPDDVTCASPKDCPGKQTCAGDGQCRDGCAAASECVAMQTCATQGVCAEAAEVDPMGNLKNAGGGSGQGGSSGGSAGASAGTGGTGAAGGSTAGQGGSTAGQGGASAGQGGSSQGGASGAGGTGGCAADFADCDMNGSCETNITTLTNCGACGVSCSSPNTTMTACEAGACKIAECKPGYSNCDNDAKTGCESNTSADSAHCGSCERDCLGGACAAGLCGGLVVAQFAGNSLAALGVNDNYIFALQMSTPRIMRFPMEPTPTSLAGTVIRTIGNATGVVLRVEGDSVYWTEQGAPSALFKYPSDGSDITPVPFFTTPSKPAMLTVTPSAFYWVDGVSSTKAIYTRAKDGSGSDITLLTRPNVTSFTMLAAGPSHLAWVERVGSKYTLWRSQLDGQNPEILDDTLSDLVGYTVTPTDLYYTIRKVTPTGAVKRQAWADPPGPKTVALFDQPYNVYEVGGSFLVQVDAGPDSDSIFRMQPDGSAVKIGKVSSLGALYAPASKFAVYRPSSPGALYRFAY